MVNRNRLRLARFVFHSSAGLLRRVAVSFLSSEKFTRLSCFRRNRFDLRETEFTLEYDCDWGTIERKENRATVDQISSKSLPRISNDRFRSSIVIVLELVLVLDLCCRQTGREFRGS